MSRPPVIGIGASAGGLQALQTFLENVGDDLHAPIVVVMHLSPSHESQLAELLQSHTQRHVLQVEQDTLVESDHVYVIPPNRNLSAVDSHLRPTELEGEIGDRAPIDHFFRTLATNDGPAAVAVVLTGTGSDGTVGAKLIKEAGGLLAVQDPDEAAYDGMPSSVVETGLADVVAPLHELPGAIARFLRNTPVETATDVEESGDEEDQDVFREILSKIRTRRGHDFRSYKRTSVMRRMRHRMQILGMPSFEAYAQRLEEVPDEVDQLVRDLLITVTHFFRDPDAFDYLAEEVIPGLFEGKDGDDQVRVWSIGCATGEEAYSLAILMLEHAATLDDPPDVQVFASDVHDDALAVARKGRYPEGIANDVRQDRLARYFTGAEGGGYRVRKELRNTVLFARHDVLSDPPFLHLDLVSCRNLLIYLARDVHEDLFNVFHHALRPGGHLMLGSSENVEGASGQDFEARPHRIFHRLDTAAPRRRVPVPPVYTPRQTGHEEVHDAEGPKASFATLHRRMLDGYGPPSVLANRAYEIVHLSNDAGRYLRAPSGEATYNLLKVVREDLRVDVHAVLHQAFEDEGPARSSAVPIVVDGERRDVSIWAYAASRGDVAGLVLVTFQESVPLASTDGEGHDVEDVADAQAELESTRKRLRAVIAEYETSQEELRSSNEELQSINEELQSTTEELQTSKEELESMNEELLAVSNEHKNEIKNLGAVAADHEALMRAIDVAALLLDRELKVKRFTPKLFELFNLVPTDVGRPLAHVTHKLGAADVAAVAESVLERREPSEMTVSSEDGSGYLMRVAPSRAPDDAIIGVVIHFVETAPVTEAVS